MTGGRGGKEPGGKSAKMPRAVLSAETVKTIDDVYDVLAAALPFPDWFGRNLDALWDTLTADVPGPFEIVVEETEALAKALGPYWLPLLTVLRDLAAERDDAHVHIESDIGNA